jgi:hypothetical protein
MTFPTVRTASSAQGVFHPPLGWDASLYEWLTSKTGAALSPNSPVPPFAETELVAFALYGPYEGLQLEILDLRRAEVVFSEIA